MAGLIKLTRVELAILLREGSVFLTDGVLGMRAGISRVGKHLELGERARLIGFARALFGAIAYGISAFGVALFTRLI